MEDVFLEVCLEARINARVKEENWVSVVSQFQKVEFYSRHLTFK